MPHSLLEGTEVTHALSPPALSLVICTRNRLNKLRRCVDALFSVITKHDWEVVFVDNGSSDGTSEYLESISQQRLNSCLYVKTVLEPKQGLSFARNTGWHSAIGEIIAFTDDDCYVSKDYVNSVIQVFDEDPNIGFLGGRILLFDQLDHRITTNESLRRNEFRPRTFIPANAIHGANFAFRKGVLEQIGGFDERLGTGTPFPSEDLAAAAAAVWSDAMGVYDPRPVVYHHHGRRTKKEVQELMNSYHAGRGAYYIKYINNKASRKIYFKKWIKSIIEDCIFSFEKGDIPDKSIRELYGGMRFILGNLHPKGIMTLLLGAKPGAEVSQEPVVAVTARVANREIGFEPLDPPAAS